MTMAMIIKKVKNVYIMASICTVLFSPVQAPLADNLNFHTYCQPALLELILEAYTEKEGAALAFIERAEIKRKPAFAY